MSWPLVKLRDCCEVVGGATPKREVPEYWDSPDVPWVTPKDVSDLASPTLEDAPEYISVVGFKSCSTSMLPKGSVLVTSRAPIGNIAIAGRDLCTNQGFKSLIPGKSVDGLYLYYCMKHSSQRLQALGNGATFKEVSKKIVEEFEIPLPPLLEQKRIAAILDKADAIRRKRQQAIKLADDFLRAVFLDMFGDPVTNPKGWEVRAIDELCLEIVDCVNRTAPTVDYLTPYKMIRTTNVRNYTLDTENVRYVDEETYRSWVRRLTPEVGDIVFTREAPAGEAAVIRTNEKIFLGQRTMHFRPDHTTVSSDYLLFELMGSGVKSQINKMHAGSTVTHLSVPECKKFKIRVPPIELQKRFESIKNTVLKVQKTGVAASDTSLFESVSQKAFSGQL
ncbi:restriction endonuclease subunit S [Stutzerimonas kunmingensis]|uniref:restriction endonuclease subunit S n=1 Tax=Stutzerimonas kunmingensis TaxID=1211807 RepID=UPI0028964854|nr:restriction endonuclease subunit S [Stutzerimonas kunmingensis]